MNKDGTLTPKEANVIYNILVDYCGVDESRREDFIYVHTNAEQFKTLSCSEFRIGGSLGFGAKFRINRNKIYVDYYREDQTIERDEIVEKTNESLAQIVSHFKQEE